MGSKSGNKKKARDAREKRELIEIESQKKGVRRYLWGDCDILVGLEKVENQDSVWHININTKSRSITVEEIVYIRYMVVPPDVIMIMFTPKDQNPYVVDLMQVRFTK